MRMELTENFSDDTCRLLGLACMPESKSVHSEKHPSVHRLETIPHIRKSTGHYDRHRIVDVRASHLLVDVHLLYPTCLYLIFHMMFSYLFTVLSISPQSYNFFSKFVQSR